MGLFKSVPRRGSSVKKDLPKLREIKGAIRALPGRMVKVAFGEFRPTHRFHEFAGAEQVLILDADLISPPS